MKKVIILLLILIVSLPQLESQKTIKKAGFQSELESQKKIEAGFQSEIDLEKTFPDIQPTIADYSGYYIIGISEWEAILHIKVKKNSVKAFVTTGVWKKELGGFIQDTTTLDKPEIVGNMFTANGWKGIFVKLKIDSTTSDLRKSDDTSSIIRGLILFDSYYPVNTGRFFQFGTYSNK